MGDSPAELQKALDAARALHGGAQRLHNAAFGAAYSYSSETRAADKGIAVREWIGTTRDTFESDLYKNEVESVNESIREMRNEASAWADFWAEATEEREYNEAMEQHSVMVSRHEESVAKAMEENIDYLGFPPPVPTRQRYSAPLPPDYPPGMVPDLGPV